MLRRLAPIVALVLLLSAPAAGQGVDERRRSVEERIERLRDRIAEADRKEGVLTTEISAVSTRIRGLQSNVDSAQARVSQLERELTVYRNRLARLTQVLEFQTGRLALLTRENTYAQRQVELRLVELYQREEVDAVTLVLTASSVSDLIDGIDYAQEINRQDKRVASQFAEAKQAMATARARTNATRRSVASTTAAVESRTNEERAVRDRLIRSQEALQAARGDKQRTLASIQADEEEFLHEVAGLERVSAQLAAQIRSAQSSSSSSAGVAYSTSTRAASASGFVWPVSGAVTSGYGWRWGRMHEGLDIAVPTGTPVAAAASGTVIYAGWMGGYGNLVVIDHGGGVATAYAHNSSVGVGVGQAVAQGQIVSYAGSTGNSTGPHVHFEVRVSGGAADPLGYL